jgi:hypothetical protein
MVYAMKRRRTFAYLKISIAISVLAFYCVAVFHEVLELCPRLGESSADKESDHDCAFCTLLRTPGIPAYAIIVAIPVETEMRATVDLVDHFSAQHRKTASQRAPPSSFVLG